MHAQPDSLPDQLPGCVDTEFSMNKVFSVLMLLLFVSGSYCPVVVAQDIQTKGTIRGTVLDASGAALPGVQVTAIGPMVERTVTANAAGVYEVINLIPVQYTVRAM